MILLVCVSVCMKKKQEANEQTKKIEPHVFFLISSHKFGSSSLTYVQRDTKKEKKRNKERERKRRTRQLAAEHGQQTKTKKIDQEPKNDRIEGRPYGDIHNNGNQGQKRKETERERRSCMHTLTDAHHHHQNGTRDEVKKKTKKDKKADRDKKNSTRKRNLVNEQRTKDPRKYSHSSQKISTNKKEEKNWGRQEKNKTNKK